MGQVLHGSAATTRAVRAATRRSKATVAELAEQCHLNEKAVRKWRSRTSVEDARMGPKQARSIVCVRSHCAEGWFQGMSSPRRVILWSGMRARVSASQASGSAPFSLAVSIRV